MTVSSNLTLTLTLALLCTALVLAPACTKVKDSTQQGGQPAAKQGGQPAAKQDGQPAAKPRKSNHARIQGKWKIDFERMKTIDPDVQKMTPEQLTKLEAVINKMVITVTKDTMSMKGGPKVGSDTYKVISDEGDNLKIESTDDKGKVSNSTVVFTDDDTITVTEIDADGKKEVVALFRMK